MSSPFTITPSAKTVTLGSNHQGQVVFTVENTTTHTIRGHARMVVQPDTAQAWLELAGEAEQVFAGTSSQHGSNSQQYTMKIAAPANAPTGSYSLQLNVVDLANPDDNFTEGPAVTFAIAPPPIIKKRFPWWVVAVGAGIVLLLGVGIYGLIRISQQTQINPPTPAVAIPHWANNSLMPTARYGLATVLGSDNRMYAIGGFTTGNQPAQTIEVYDPTMNSWTELAPMPTARGNIAAVRGPNGRIYVFGGIGTHVALETVEIYDPTTDSWTTAAPMPTARYGLATVLGADGRIYAIGGMGQSNQPLQTVEVYDPVKNSWTELASMPTARSGLSAVLEPDGRIYAIGGSGPGNQPLQTVEIYNPQSNSWTSATSLSTPRSNFAAVVSADGHIYVMGGNTTGSTAQQTVEVYDP
ncbi:MAG: Kelch repeat-containing protein, partial [Ktedonobacteraceae bacterium]